MILVALWSQAQPVAPGVSKLPGQKHTRTSPLPQDNRGEVSVWLGSQSSWPRGPGKLTPLGSETQTCPSTLSSWTKRNEDYKGAPRPPFSISIADGV